MEREMAGWRSGMLGCGFHKCVWGNGFVSDCGEAGSGRLDVGSTCMRMAYARGEYLFDVQTTYFMCAARK